jgi:hypothetical protein
MAIFCFSKAVEKNIHQGRAFNDMVESLEEVAAADAGRTASSDDDPSQ